MKTKFGNKKENLPGLMITIMQTRRSSAWSLILLVFILGGCRPSSPIGIKDLLDFPYREVYVNVRCTQIGKNDTMDICYPYGDLVYSLGEDSLTKYLGNKIADYVLNGKVLVLPENHFLLQHAVVQDYSIDSIYALGYGRLLQTYFFCHNELDKERSCCIDWLHSACGNSVYFGHRSSPCYYKDGDEIMNNKKQDYIISLLYKHNIYCLLDENGNVCLLNYNLKKEDFNHIPFPIVEIR